MNKIIVIIIKYNTFINSNQLSKCYILYIKMIKKIITVTLKCVFGNGFFYYRIN